MIANVRFLRSAIGLLLLLLAAFVVPLRADTVGVSTNPLDPFVINFDENGNATVSINGAPAITVISHLGTDPTGGSTNPVLIYNLPSTIGPGDLGIADSTGAISDIVRFYNDGTGGHLIFYSDSTGTGDLADTGLPSNANIALTVTESNGAFSFFSGGSAGVNNDYYGISNAVSAPEPSSMLLLGVGLFGFLPFARRRFRSA